MFLSFNRGAPYEEAPCNPGYLEHQGPRNRRMFRLWRSDAVLPGRHRGVDHGHGRILRHHLQLPLPLNQ